MNRSLGRWIGDRGSRGAPAWRGHAAAAPRCWHLGGRGRLPDRPAAAPRPSSRGVRGRASPAHTSGALDGGVAARRGASAALSHRLRPPFGVSSPTTASRSRPRPTARGPAFESCTSSVPADEVTAVARGSGTTASSHAARPRRDPPAHQVERAVYEADMRQLLTDLSLAGPAGSLPAPPGTPLVRRSSRHAPSLPAAQLRPASSRSAARQACHDRPQRERPSGLECDCVWHEQRLDRGARRTHVARHGGGPSSTIAPVTGASGSRVARVRDHLAPARTPTPTPLAADLRRVLRARPRRRRGRARAAGP